MVENGAIQIPMPAGPESNSCIEVQIACKDGLFDLQIDGRWHDPS